MKRFLAYFLIFILLMPLGLPSPAAFAAYNDEDTVEKASGGGGSGLATQAGVGVLSYLVTRAVQKKNAGKAGEEPLVAAPPQTVSVAEFEVPPGMTDKVTAEVTVQKGNSTVNVNTPVAVAPPPGAEDKNKCCKLTSLTVTNIWSHLIKVSVSGGGTQTIQPGARAEFSGELGECPRIKVESAEGLGDPDYHLVAEDVPLCCKDLKSGKFRSFFAIQILRYNFVDLDKDCGGGGQTPPPPEKPKTPKKPEEPKTPPTEPPNTPSTPGESPNPPGKTPPEEPPIIPKTPPPSPYPSPKIPKIPPSPPPRTPRTPTGEPDCACCCHQVHQWSAETPIQYSFASPSDPNVRVPLGKEFPLVVNAIDMDSLTVSCNQKGVECGSCACKGGGGGTGGITDGPVGGGGGTTSGGAGGSSVMIATKGGGMCKKPCESCTSLKKILLASPLHFRWELISGPGWLKSAPYYPQERSATAEGPAAVYVAPETLPAGASRTAAILLTIDDTPYVADLDDPPVTAVVTINLIGRKEAGGVPVASPSLSYGSVTNPPPTCPCKPVTSWDTGSGIKQTVEHDTSFSVCADSYTVFSAPTEDVDTIHTQCSGPKCSSPEVQYNLHDATTYNWTASAGMTIGLLENFVYKAPSDAGDVTVKGVASDSGLQYSDGPLPLPDITLKVGKITLESVSPPGPATASIVAAPAAPLLLGDDLTVNYKIEGIQFERVEMRVYNKNGDIIYRRSDLEKTIGSHETTWPKARWNQEPHIGAYANPKNGPYEIEIAANRPRCVSSSKNIDTKFVFYAEVRDLKAGSATRASGLDTAIPMLKVILNGPGTRTFGGSDLRIANLAGLAAGSYGKSITLDKTDLNQLEDGKWTLQVKDLYDNVGNLTDADPSTPASDPYETEIELW